MPYDDSEQQKLNDYLTGQAFGASYNTYSSLGAQHYKSNFAPAPTTLAGGASNSHTASQLGQAAKLTRAERKALQKQQARQQAVENDRSFSGLLVSLSLAGIAYLDYLYLPEMPWWAHLLVVLPVPLILGAILNRYPKFVRRLRYIVLGSIGLAIAALVVIQLDLLPFV